MLSNYFDRIVGRGTFCETGLAGLRPTDAGLSIDAPLYCVKKNTTSMASTSIFASYNYFSSHGDSMTLVFFAWLS